MEVTKIDENILGYALFDVVVPYSVMNAEMSLSIIWILMVANAILHFLALPNIEPENTGIGR